MCCNVILQQNITGPKNCMPDSLHYGVGLLLVGHLCLYTHSPKTGCLAFDSEVRCTHTESERRGMAAPVQSTRHIARKGWTNSCELCDKKMRVQNGIWLAWAESQLHGCKDITEI